jgi:hypothetical protein
MTDIILLILLYAFLGGAIKYIDQAYDERAYSVRSAGTMAVMAGITMGYLMAWDSPFSTAFFSAMLLSLVLARKIDNRSFALGTLLAAGSLIAFYPSFEVTWEVWPITAFFVAGFVDEIADGMVDRYDLEGLLQSFLNYRPFSDIALIVMIAMGLFPWSYLLPYFGFTLSYMLVERCSERERSITTGVSWIRDHVLRRAD